MTTPALSELGVTEFLTLARVGFVPRGLVIGSCVYGAGTQYDWQVATAGQIELFSNICNAGETASSASGAALGQSNRGPSDPFACGS